MAAGDLGHGSTTPGPTPDPTTGPRVGTDRIGDWQGLNGGWGRAAELSGGAQDDCGVAGFEKSLEIKRGTNSVCILKYLVHEPVSIYTNTEFCDPQLVSRRG